MKFTVEIPDDTVEWADHKDAPDFYKRVLGKPLRDHLRFEGIRFQQKHRVTDAYMFCTSREFSVEIMQKSPYNACVRIDDPIRFVGHVTAHLRNEITATVVGRCVYMEKMIYHRLPRRPHPGFVKDKEYEFWKELRAVWVPEALKIEPRIETIPELCTTCSLYHVAEDSQ